jgi:hypothetical protein
MIFPEVVSRVIVPELVPYLLPALLAILAPLLSVIDTPRTVVGKTLAAILAVPDPILPIRQAVPGPRSLTNSRTFANARSLGRTRATGRELASAGSIISQEFGGRSTCKSGAGSCGEVGAARPSRRSGPRSPRAG